MGCREVEIEIAPDGTVRGDIRGFRGPGCRELANVLAEIVGEEVNCEPTAEYYQDSIDVDVDVENGR